MNIYDIIFVITLFIRAAVFVYFVYLDRDTWSWKKGCCAVVLLGGPSDISNENTGPYSIIISLVIFTVTVILSIRILNFRRVK